MSAARPVIGSKWESSEMMTVYIVKGWTNHYGGMVIAEDNRSGEEVYIAAESFGTRLRAIEEPEGMEGP
jgi:hypothetical protein